MEKYFYLKAISPYCGEEMDDYACGVDIDDSHIRELADDLLYDLINEWKDTHDSDWKDEGFSSYEEWEEDYYSRCHVFITEISYKTYLEEAIGG